VHEKQRPDVRIIGTSTSAGGQFRHVKLTGESTFEGDVDCTKLSCTGELVVNGALRTEELNLTGEIDVRGFLEARKIGGRGELNVVSGIRGENIKFTGNIEVKGDCEAASLELSGGFLVEGLLSAENLEVSMYGPCSARELGGGKLRIKRSKAVMLTSLVKSKSVAALTADIIEGDNIELEHTIANIVRGNRVLIGAGCKIDRVEYRDVLDIHKTAIVNEKIKL
jgi:cytoskeletal protein CcmA (bactofilin family)